MTKQIKGNIVINGVLSSIMYVFSRVWSVYLMKVEKSRIRETKHLSTAADSNTNTIVWWTKKTPKPDFFFLTGKITKNTKTQKRLEI